MDELDKYEFNDLMEVIEDKFSKEIELYVEENLGDVDDDALIKELELRNYIVMEDYDEAEGENDIEIPRNFTKEQLREHLLMLLGMGHYHSNEEISRRVLEELG